MSHFTVLVISPTKLDEESLRPILQPFHEFECTGIDDQYVIDVDKTDEVMEQFNKPVSVVKLVCGTFLDRYDPCFYVEVPDQSWGDKEFKLPDGAVELELPAVEARQHGLGYATPAECATDYFGAFERDGRFYRHTNPNAKWDGWTIGGRWAGMFAPNYQPETDPDNEEICDFCHKGKQLRDDGPRPCPHCNGKGVKTKWPSRWKNVGNVAQLKDIPLEALRNEAEVAALKQFDKAQEVIAGRSYKSWDTVKEECGGDIEQTRESYWSQPPIEDLKKAEIIGFFDDDDVIKKFWMTRAQVATRARRRAVQTFAVVKDGQWYERGEMGWFACVSNEKDGDVWDEEFAKLLDDLPPETWLAVVDCHI
ncbi:zinc finger-like domain-containing protein [Bradyrhizobium sp. Tv2a-2]|uniref:zinc finger-like domain-containing protein n=1 Tax=Bradyrhizobium sp. Tv2a-2 TaxID=113395 RepID=UPI000408E45F|nr:zinc finger-like domain-containing protein [Bradyrhizobium sp. Tv2a-2]